MKKNRGLLISLSAGGSNEELAECGYGLEHIDELMVRSARKLLRHCHRLAFGGTLRLRKERADLTQSLIDAARGWLDEESAKKSNVTKPGTWPLTNYSAWPFHHLIDDQQRARLVGVCRFIEIDPKTLSPADLKSLAKQWKEQQKKKKEKREVIPEARLYASDALSEMRERSARDTDLRIVWGGRIRGAAGWLAGIFEEVACSLRYKKPILIIGGFGGCAKLLAEYLVNKNSQWPDDLSLAACAHETRDAIVPDARRPELAERFEESKRLLVEFRSRFHAGQDLYGVGQKTFAEALTTDSTSKAIGLAAEAAAQCLG